MLGPRALLVFSKRAVLRTGVCAHQAPRYERALARRRELRAIRRRRASEHAREARREGADALEANREADLGDRMIRPAQQRRRPLEPAGQQVRVRRLAERAPKRAAEVSARKA